MNTLLSPRQLGEAIGVSESSLKRWADEGRIVVTRTAGGHRRIEISEALRFIRETHQTVVKPHLLGLPGVGEPGEEGARTPLDLLVQALLAGDGPAVRAMVTSWYLSNKSVADICDGPLANALRRIGAMWCHDRQGIFFEHRATDLVIQALQHLRTLLPTRENSSPIALGGAPSNDPHFIPSLMAATVLASQGWRDFNIGPDIPLDVLGDMARQDGASLVWVSVSMQEPPQSLPEEVRAMARSLGEVGIRVIVGGRTWHPDGATSPENLTSGKTMADLEGFAGRLHPPRRRKAEAAG